MTINLKQIRPLDNDNIKLDKINYNFDQLIVNGGGPKGAKGLNGSAGPQGFQGERGFQGDRGFQGVQGSSASETSNFWEDVPQDLVSANTTATLFLKHSIIDPITYASVIAAGYINTNPRYNSQQPVPVSPLLKYQWVVNKIRTRVSSNLRFTSVDVPGNAFDINMDNVTPLSEGVSTFKLNLGFINTLNSQLNFKASLMHVIRSSSTGDDLLYLKTQIGAINVDSVFTKPVTFNSDLYVKNSGEGVNKIATSSDATGLVTFKTSAEIGGSVPVGTIVSILPSIFSNTSNFVYSQTIDTASNPNVPLQIKIGAGGGDYSGWYLCNGQTWTDGNVSYEVPDLSSFSYFIVANPITTDPNSQGYILVENNETQLIGGADINMLADQVGTSSALYDNDLTDNSTDPNILSGDTGSFFNIRKLPQIIYLGINDLYWSQLGEDQDLAGDYVGGSEYDATDYNTIV
jgi:hypothetical protein